MCRRPARATQSNTHFPDLARFLVRVWIIRAQCITDVRCDRIKEVDSASDERSIKFTRTDGSTGITTAPRRDERMMDNLLNHNVAIDQAPPESGITFWW